MKCQICNKECNGIRGLGNHVVKNHNIKEYYDTFLKKENEGKCKVCGDNTKFYRLSVGYRTTCGQKCSRKLMNMPEARNKSKKTIFKKYGVKYASQINGIGQIISEKAKLRLSDETERKKISELTKLAMARPEVRENYLNSRKPVSDEQKQKLSDLMKLRHLDPIFRSKIYTEERNKKISNSKIEYWNTHPEERKRIMDIWKDKKETKLEFKMYKLLDDKKIKYQKRFVLNDKQYDAYLTDYNVLLEFDGDFWHKNSLDECHYTFQTTNYYNDIVKNKIAKKNNIRLFRIKELDSDEMVNDLLTKITL